MNKKIIGGVLAGAAIAASIAYTVFDYKTTVYQCSKCRAIHKPPVKEWACSMYMFGKRLLKCPKCGKTGWNDRFVLVDKNDFI